MHLGVLASGCMGGFMASVFSDSNVAIFSPCSFGVHALALTHLNFKAKLIKGLLYFSKPIDRIIQSIVGPILSLIGHLKPLSRISNYYSEKKYPQMVFEIVVYSLVIPIFVINSLLDSVGLLINGAIQVLLPYQTLYAVFKDDASDEFLDLRDGIKKAHDVVMDLSS